MPDDHLIDPHICVNMKLLQIYVHNAVRQSVCVGDSTPREKGDACRFLRYERTPNGTPDALVGISSPLATNSSQRCSAA